MRTSPVSAQVTLPTGVTLRVLDWTPATRDAARAVFVLVHGLASNALLWGGVGQALADRGYRAVAVDQRGHGRSDKPDGGYDTASVVADLEALIDRLGLDRPVVAGQSWGANVVIDLAAQHPGRVRGVVAVDGGFIELSSKFETWEACRAALSPPRFAGTPAATFEGWIRDAHPDWPESGIVGALGNVEFRADGTVAPWLTFERHLLVLHGLWSHRPLERFPLVAEPVLWLPADSGDVAWTTDKRASLLRASGLLKHSRVEWFSPAHHDLHAQHPDRVAELLVDAVESGWMA